LAEVRPPDRVPLDLRQLRRVVGEALELARRMRELAVVAETAADPAVEGAGPRVRDGRPETSPQRHRRC